MSTSQPVTDPTDPTDPTVLRHAYDFLHQCRRAAGELIEGHQQELDLLMVCCSALGHALLVGPSGASKTRAARALAHVLGVSYGRVQGRSDLLPSGVVGYHRDVLGREEFVSGPIMHGLTFADEINRSPEEAKAAFLEPMEERHVTVDGRRYHIPTPGLVIATMNPADGGTYPLLHPERERYLLHVPFDYLSTDEAVNWLKNFARYDGMPDVPEGEENATTQQNAAALTHLRQVIVHGIGMTPEMMTYVVALVHTTRQHSAVLEGCGDRAIAHLFLAAKATALFNGHESVWADDVQQIAPYVLGHRITTERDRGDFAAGREVVQQAQRDVPVPRSLVATATAMARRS